MKKTIYTSLSVIAATFLTVACQSVEIDNILENEGKEVNEEVEPVPERTTIPYSLKITTQETKVDYSDGAHFVLKEGDYLHVVGTSREDLEGTLAYDSVSDKWSGELSYLTDSGEPDTDEALTVTLVHADNPDMSTYATAIVGAVSPGWASLLHEAVEKYSWFTAATTLDEEDPVTLLQQATFLDVTVTFDFDGSREVEAGQALVDLVTTRGSDRERSQFYPDAEHNEDYYVHFMAVVPGGQKVNDFTLTVGDRAVTFSNGNTELARNNKYTVTRTVVYGPQLGDPFWSDGTYGRLQHANSEGVSIVGIIVYVNHDYTPGSDAANIDDAITEKSAGYGRGLVMALHNVPVPQAPGDMWGTSGGFWGARWCLAAGNGVKRTNTLVTTPAGTLGVDALNGLDNTNRIVEALESNSAAYLAQHYADAPAYTSGWFLPSIGQWIYTISIDGFGGADHASNWQNNSGINWLTRGSTSDLVRVMNNNGSSENLLVKSLNDRLKALQDDYAATDFAFTYDEFGWEVNGAFGDNYWTSTEYDTSNAFRMNLGSVETDKSGNKYSTIKVKQEGKTYYNTWREKEGFIMRIRPFLAF